MLNKADLLGGIGAVPGLNGSDGSAVAVSALTGEGLDDLRAALDARLSAGWRWWTMRSRPATARGSPGYTAMARWLRATMPRAMCG